MEDRNHFEIMSEQLIVKDVPAFRFVLDKNNFEIIGAWDIYGRHYSRKEFNKDMEELAKQKESKEHDKNFHKNFNL